jgi:hypothetical protein
MSKFSFNWGHGIVLTFIAFAGFMAYFYVNMSRQQIDLVGDHYYEDGQKFQEKLNRMSETQKLPDKVEYMFDAKENSFALKVSGNKTDLKVDFFFPGDAKLDQHFTYAVPSEIITIETQKLHVGKWKIYISWKQDGKEYLEETEIKITKP